MREYVLLCYLSVLGNPVETIAESKAKIWSVKCFISPPPPPHTHTKLPRQLYQLYKAMFKLSKSYTNDTDLS